jgi:Fur family transcriptional regulator, ferric uptake regulator
MAQRLERLCKQNGVRMTVRRRLIARVLSEADDHPDVEELYRRASRLDAGISLATVYRTVKVFEDAGVLNRLDFGDGRARYEVEPRHHHDHLIDATTGEVIEFHNAEIERLQEEVAQRLGYRLVGHRLSLYGVRLKGRRTAT